MRVAHTNRRRAPPIGDHGSWRGRIAQPRREVRQIDHLAGERVRAVAAEIELAGGQDVVAALIDRIAGGVADPLTGPLAALVLDRLLSSDLDARAETRRREIAV